MTTIEEVRVMLKTGEVQVRFNTDDSIHFEVFNDTQKDQFINAVDDPANGGAQGFSVPYLTALGW